MHFVITLSDTSDFIREQSKAMENANISLDTKKKFKEEF